ncbi:MAG: PilZ domain-containing protein [Planctomycetales bacterium]|nr:PilZ domain-containing protein [Planctomycetales bacterium]
MTDNDFMGQRHEPRFSVRNLDATVVTVAVKTAESQEPITITGVAADVSATGLRLALDDVPPKGSQVALHFQIPEIKVDLMLEGVIRWVQPKDRKSWWVGCSLDTPIPDVALQDMASHAIMDRRQDDRLPAATPAKVKWELSTDVTDVVVKNYSLGGCAIETESPVEPASDRMLLLFESPDKSESVQIPVRVVWSRGTRFGCSFLSNRGYLQMRKFVESDSQAAEREKRAAVMSQRFAPSTKWRWIAIAAIVVLSIQAVHMLDLPIVNSIRGRMRSMFDSTAPEQPGTSTRTVVDSASSSDPDA